MKKEHSTLVRMICQWLEESFYLNECEEMNLEISPQINSRLIKSGYFKEIFVFL